MSEQRISWDDLLLDMQAWDAETARSGLEAIFHGILQKNPEARSSDKELRKRARARATFELDAELSLFLLEKKPNTYRSFLFYGGAAALLKRGKKWWGEDDAQVARSISSIIDQIERTHVWIRHCTQPFQGVLDAQNEGEEELVVAVETAMEAILQMINGDLREDYLEGWAATVEVWSGFVVELLGLELTQQEEEDLSLGIERICPDWEGPNARTASELTELLLSFRKKAS